MLKLNTLPKSFFIQNLSVTSGPNCKATPLLLGPLPGYDII